MKDGKPDHGELHISVARRFGIMHTRTNSTGLTMTDTAFTLTPTQQAYGGRGVVGASPQAGPTAW